MSRLLLGGNPPSPSPSRPENLSLSLFGKIKVCAKTRKWINEQNIKETKKKWAHRVTAVIRRGVVLWSYLVWAQGRRRRWLIFHSRRFRRRFFSNSLFLLQSNSVRRGSSSIFAHGSVFEEWERICIRQFRYGRKGSSPDGRFRRILRWQGRSATHRLRSGRET